MNLVNESSSEPESDDSEDEEDKQMDGNIWKAIVAWCVNNEIDALNGLRYWFDFCHELENDPTIQKIMVYAIKDEVESLSFKEALHFALMKILDL